MSVVELRAPAAPADGPAVRHGAHEAPPLVRGSRWERILERPDLLIATSIGIVGVIVRFVGLFGTPGLADDEGTYVAQAQAVRWGELAHYTYWYDHPPLGWIQLAAFDWIPQSLLPGVTPVAASRVVPAFVGALTAALVYVLARRLRCGRIAASCAGAAAALSPLAVTLQRQVYLDTLATGWVVAAFCLAADRQRRLWSHVGAGVCFSIAVLTKETVVVILPALLWQVWQHTHPRTRTTSLVGFGCVFALIVAYYPLMALLRGELLPGQGHVSLVDGVLFQLSSRDGSGAFWVDGSAANTVVRGWAFFDPWLLTAGVVAIPMALAVRRLRPVAAALLILVVVGARPSGYLPAMYVLTMVPFLALLPAATIEAGWRFAMRHLPERAQWARFGLLGVLGVAAALAVGLILPSWEAAQRGLMTSQANSDRTAAEAWMQREVTPDSVILTDDVSWVTLVRREVAPRQNVIWFYKIDTDPALEPLYPEGWRDVDYVLSTDQLRQAVAGDATLVNVATALRESQVVASFGSGDSVVEIRRVSAAERGNGS